MDAVFSEDNYLSSQSASDQADALEQKLAVEMKSAPKGSLAQRLVLAIFQALGSEEQAELSRDMKK